MKNKEKFSKEIFDIACKGDSIAVTIANNEIVPCGNIECEKCIFEARRHEECSDKITIWCESEYVEKPTLTSREKNFLDTLIPNCKYIARDSNGDIYVYYNKPIYDTRTRSWISKSNSFYYVSKYIFGSMFDFIIWTDEEPWSIEDLKKLEVKE